MPPATSFYHSTVTYLFLPACRYHPCSAWISGATARFLSLIRFLLPARYLSFRAYFLSLPGVLGDLEHSRCSFSLWVGDHCVFCRLSVPFLHGHTTCHIHSFDANHSISIHSFILIHSILMFLPFSFILLHSFLIPPLHSWFYYHSQIFIRSHF